MTAQTPENVLDQFVGKYVIVRTRDAGVHAGVLQATNGRAYVLDGARRLWYWKYNKGDLLSSVTLQAPPAIALTESCEVLTCSAEVEAGIRG